MNKPGRSNNPEEKINFSAPWSRSLTISTIGVIVILFIGGILLEGLGTILFIGVMLGALMLMVTGYTIQGCHLIVRGLVWRKTYNLADLMDVTVEPNATKGAFRTFGLGGLFSSIGHFSSPSLGKFIGFMTNSENTVVLDFKHQRVVVTPDDPNGFRDAIYDEIRCSGLGSRLV